MRLKTHQNAFIALAAIAGLTTFARTAEAQLSVSDLHPSFYGSTELGASRAWFVIPEEPTPGPQPIGSAIPGTQLLVVDAELQQCAIDAPGEIIVRARNLPVGYANDHDHDATGFTTNPFTGDADDIVYRTGDLGWYRPDGNIQLAGRTDDQVKIGGFRLDPGELDFGS